MIKCAVSLKQHIDTETHLYLGQFTVRLYQSLLLIASEKFFPENAHEYLL